MGCQGHSRLLGLGLGLVPCALGSVVAAPCLHLVSLSHMLASSRAFPGPDVPAPVPPNPLKVRFLGIQAGPGL